VGELGVEGMSGRWKIGLEGFIEEYKALVSSVPDRCCPALPCSAPTGPGLA